MPGVTHTVHFLGHHITTSQPSDREGCSSLLLLLLQSEATSFCVGCFTYHFEFNTAAFFTSSCSFSEWQKLYDIIWVGWAGNVSQRSQREFPNKWGMTCLQQKHTPPCIFTCGLQISRAESACSAGAITYLPSNPAGMISGALPENSAARKLCSHTQIFFPCYIFLVDHFQRPVHVALCLRHFL